MYICICAGFGPYAALSPEALQSMTLARDTISQSQTIRKEVADAIDHTERLQRAAHSSVNEGITRKLAQTVIMTVSARIINSIPCMCCQYNISTH